MSEVVKFCINCKHLGLDFETGSCYCSLSNRPDKLPSSLFCDEFCLKSYIERLQEENKELKEQLEIDKNQINYFIEENEELKEKIYIYENSIIANHDRAVGKRLMEVLLALEEIRNIAKEFLKDLCDDCAWYNTDECSPEGYNCGEMNKIISKIREVLNDN